MRAALPTRAPLPALTALAGLLLAGVAVPLASAHGVAASGGDELSEYVVMASSTGTRADQSNALGRALAMQDVAVTHRYQTLPAADVRLTPAQAQRLRSTPGLVVGANQSFHLPTLNQRPKITDSTQLDPANWGLDRLDQRALPLNQEYRYGTTGKGVTVYMIDSGFWAEHDEFAGRDDAGVDLVGKPSDPTFCKAHGTHVAGIVGGTTYGVAKEATLAGVRAFGCKEGGGTKDIVKAIDWILSNAARPAVVNMSFIGDADPVVDAAVAKLYNANILPIVAAGNYGRDACLSTPARVPEALTIGFTARTDAAAKGTGVGRCVGLFAPGDDIVSASVESVSASFTASGSSMAAPMVAGVAARFLERHPEATAAEVRAAITEAATPNVVTPLSDAPLNGAANKLLFWADAAQAPDPQPTTPRPTVTSTSTPRPTATSTPMPTATSTLRPTTTKPTATKPITPKPTATKPITPKPTATSAPRPTTKP